MCLLGATGSSGPAGRDGSIGPAGPAGPAGPIGAIGFTGNLAIWGHSAGLVGQDAPPRTRTSSDLQGGTTGGCTVDVHGTVLGCDFLPPRSKCLLLNDGEPQQQERSLCRKKYN